MRKPWNRQMHTDANSPNSVEVRKSGTNRLKGYDAKKKIGISFASTTKKPSFDNLKYVGVANHFLFSYFSIPIKDPCWMEDRNWSPQRFRRKRKNPKTTGQIWSDNCGKMWDKHDMASRKGARDWWTMHGRERKLINSWHIKSSHQTVIQQSSNRAWHFGIVYCRNSAQHPWHSKTS